MGYTIFTREQVTPKIIQIDVLDPPRMIPAVYADPTYDSEMGEEYPGEMITPAHLAEPSWHKEDQLNIPPVITYPTTFSRFLWLAAAFDRYGDNPANRSEVWEDSAGTATYADIIAVFPGLPGHLEAAARKWGNARLSELTNPYEGPERETWHVQQREAEAWLANNNATVPMIAALSTVRNIPLALLVEKIISNVTLFRQLSGQILGKQQALIDLAYSAESLAEVLELTTGMGITIGGAL